MLLRTGQRCRCLQAASPRWRQPDAGPATARAVAGAHSRAARRPQHGTEAVAAALQTQARAVLRYIWMMQHSQSNTRCSGMQSQNSCRQQQRAAPDAPQRRAGRAVAPHSNTTVKRSVKTTSKTSRFLLQVGRGCCGRGLLITFRPVFDPSLSVEAYRARLRARAPQPACKPAPQHSCSRPLTPNTQPAITH
jgi:hypothetical protein